MSSSLSHRLLASILEKAQQEREAHMKEGMKVQQEQLAHETEEKARELQALEKKRTELNDRAKREAEDVERMREALEEQRELARDEEQVVALDKRLQDFRGSDDQALRSRLLSEGFSESLTLDMLRLRTQDQASSMNVGLHASFDRFSGGIEETVWREGQDSSQFGKKLGEDVVRDLYRPDHERPDNLYNAGLPESVTDTYRSDSLYDQQLKRSDAEEAVRRGLGLDADTSTLQYGRANR